jgi:hypothetical protein
MKSQVKCGGSEKNLDHLSFIYHSFLVMLAYIEQKTSMPRQLTSIIGRVRGSGSGLPAA